MDSIEINKNYKEKKKLEKMELKKIADISKMLTKCRLYWKQKTADNIEKVRALYISKKKKDIAKKLKKKKEDWDKKIKNQQRLIKGHKQVNYKKKDKTSAWYKKHSCSDYQFCVRVKAKDKNGYVKTIDGKIRNWKNCDAGHIFSKSKYPHLIFHPNNCFPQSKYSNKELGTTDGLIFKDAVIERIGKDGWEELVELSKDSQQANKLLKKQYRKDKYNYRHRERLKLEKLL